MLRLQRRDDDLSNAFEVFWLSIRWRVYWVVAAIVMDLAICDHDPGDVTEFDFLVDLHWSLRPFVKWDAAHLLNIAGRGYKRELESAFFPLYPLIIRCVKDCFTKHLIQGKGNETNALVISAVGVNMLLYPLASVLLWKLLDSWNVSRKWKSQALSVHICMNPASAFFVSGYSETTFSVVSWLAMYLLSELSRKSWSSKMGAILALLVASYTRSNGVLNACFGLSALLKRDKSQSLIITLLESIALGVAALLPLLVNDMTNTFRYCDNTGKNGSLEYAVSCEIPGVHSVAPPTASFFNLAHVRKYLERVALNKTSYYSYVQKKYWNVDLFASYQWRQTPNIIMATPACAIALYVLFVSKSCRNRLMTERIHLLMTLLVGVTFAHIQITTRLLMCACPIMYLGIAEILESFSIVELEIAMVTYLALFSIIGLGLHCNWYPWT